MGLEERIILQPVGQHEDARRIISDWYVLSDSSKVGHIGTIRTKDKAEKGIDEHGRLVLGNHYHEAKEAEVFRLNYGGAEVILEDVDTKERIQKLLRQGEVIQVPKRVAHTFLLEPNSELLSYALNVPPGFSPADASDLISYVLVKPVK